MNRIFVYLLVCLLVGSCTKIKPYTKAPIIEHVYMRYFVSVLEETEIIAGAGDDTIKKVELSFLLHDGDADIGKANADMPDSLLPGIHLWLYSVGGKSDEQAVAVSDTVVNHIRYEMPEIEQYHTSGQIDAQIDIAIETYHKKTFLFDTIGYRYYVVDKSGNKSNQVFTGLHQLEPFISE